MTVTLIEYLEMLQAKGYQDVPDGVIEISRLLELLEMESKIVEKGE